MLEKRKVYINMKLIIVLVIFSFFYANYRSERIMKRFEINQIEKAEDFYKSIENKLNILNIVIYQIQMMDIYKMYFFESLNETQKRYLKIKLNDEIKKSNTLYSNLGFSLNVGSVNENIIFSSQGTTNKGLFFKDQGLPKNIEDFKKYILVKDDSILIYLKMETLKGQAPVYWIISLTKHIFFSEIKHNLYNWYIDNGNYYVNLESEKYNISFYKNKISKYRIKKFFMPYFYSSFVYISPKINYLITFLYEFIKIIGIVTIMSLVLFIMRCLIFLPVKKLAQKYGYSNVDTKKEIEYLENKLDEIKLTNVKLVDEIENMTLYKLEKKIKDYLLGITKIEDEEEKDISIFFMDTYRIIIIEFTDSDIIENIYGKYKITKELFSKYFLKKIVCEIINVDYNSIVVVLENNLEELEIEKALEQLEMDYEFNFNIACTVVISDIYSNLKDISKAYREVKKILNYKFAFKEKRVIFQNCFSQNNMKKYYYPIELEAKLINKTLNSNENAIKRVLNEIFEISIGYDIEYIEIKEFSGLLYNTLSRILLQLKEINENIIFENFKIKEILYTNTFEELKKVFTDKIFYIANTVQPKDINNNSDIKTKIEIYLQENYMTDISLDNLADYLGHSFKYTSILFKKVMGDNFKNYLNIYRINKAKEFMEKNTDLKIKELAEMVGYNSSNTFIRIFKRYEGVSPGKMNTSLLKE